MAENAKPAKSGSKAPSGAASSGGGGVGGGSSAAGGMVSLETAMKAAIGSRIRVQTTKPSTIEGTVVTICPLTSLLAITTTLTPNLNSNTSTTSPAPPPAATATHIIPLSALTSFTLLPSQPPTQPLPIAPLKPSALLARANAALNLAKEKAARINKDVSKETQEIFDALYKQFPGTRWAGKDMVVLDAVLIKGPGYRVEDCKAGKGGEGAIGRVKKVLENERRRITQRDQKPVKPVIPAIPAIPALQGRERKGG